MPGLVDTHLGDVGSPNDAPYLYKSGFYYGTPNMGAVSNSAITLNRLTWTPLFFPSPKILDRIGCEIQTGATSAVVRLGIYSDTGYGSPLAPLTGSEQVVAADVATQKEATISVPVLGLVWLCGVSQGGTPTVKSMASPGLATGSSALANATNGAIAGYWSGGVSGALPNPASASDGVTTVMRVVVRVA